MAATALLKFTQDTVGTGGNGIALSGVMGQLVTVENSDNTDVASWQIDLVYTDSASAITPATPYAFSDNGSVPSAIFTPDVRRSFRFVLKVWGVINRAGTPNIDIRNFTVPESSGIIIPPVQIWPLPLPDPASGDPAAKPNEMNFGGQAGGWAGQGNDGLLNNTLTKLLVTSLRERWVDGNTTVAFAKQNGSRHTPYQAISQALNDVSLGSTDSKWVIYVAPAAYNETLSVPAQRSITLVGEDYASTSVNMTSGDTASWDITGACYLSIKNIRMFKIAATQFGDVSPNTGTLYLNDASLEYLEGSTRPIDVVGAGPNTHITLVVTTGRYAMDGVDYLAGGTCGYFAAYDTLILSSSLSITGDATMVSCQIDAGVILSFEGYAQTLYVDGMTNYWLTASNVSIVGAPTIVLMDGSGFVPPLSRVFWVDPGRTGSTETGSIAQPFLTVQAAALAAFEHGTQLGEINTIFLCPGNYTTQDLEINFPSPLTGYGQLNVIGLGGPVVTPYPNFQRPIKLGNVITSAPGGGTPPTCVLQNFACTSLLCTGGLVIKDVVADTFDFSGANVTIDSDSIMLLRNAGVSGTPPTGGLISTTTRKGLTFTVPALSASFADVTLTVTSPPIRVGDSFSVTTTSRLADVGIVDAFCNVDGDLTLRFYGTTVGGNTTVTINVNPNS